MDECAPREDISELEPGDLAIGECCRPDGASCAVGAGDCCGDAVCDPSSDTCVACGEWNQPIPELNGEPFCCEGLEARDDLCLVPCVESGACEACPGVTGTWVCTPRGSECEPPSNPGPDDCDGMDNDCDRRIDEDWESQSCEGAVVEGCDGFEAPGRTRCTADSGEICEPAPGEYCKYLIGGDLVEGNNDACGFGDKQCHVNGDADCPPSSWCITSGCGSTTGYVHCHPFAEDITCTSTGAPVPALDTSCLGDYLCWLPGELGGARACPE